MKVGIIGAAGNVGSCTAFHLAALGLADELVMLDVRQNVLASHVLDITAALSAHRSLVIKSGSYENLADADIIIIAAGLHFAVSSPARERLVQNMRMISDISSKIGENCPGALIITVTNPSDIMNYVVYLSTSLERKRLWGYNLNDTIRFRMITARSMDVEPADVEGLTGGYHPLAQVMFFSSLRIKGQPVDLQADQKTRISQELLGYLRAYEELDAGRTAAWTTASGLARTIDAIKNDRREVQSCSAVLQGEYGHNAVSLGVPAIIGRAGILSIVEWKIPPDEKAELDRVAVLAKNACGLARSITGSNRD